MKSLLEYLMIDLKKNSFWAKVKMDIWPAPEAHMYNPSYLRG
jgi:hypothetical protein